MFGRKAAYRRGYTDGLKDLKAELQAEAGRRIIDRQPYDVGTLSEDVMDTINALVRNPRDLT
jgi:hypothetical protein